MAQGLAMMGTSWWQPRSAPTRPTRSSTIIRPERRGNLYNQAKCKSLADSGLRRIFENNVVSLGGGADQQGTEEIDNGRILELGGLGKAGENADALRALGTSGPHTYFPENHQGAQGALGEGDLKE